MAPNRKSRPSPPKPAAESLLADRPQSEKEAQRLLGADGRRAKRHWAKFLPKAYRNLVKHDRLYRALHLAESLTIEAELRLREAGLPSHQAQEALAQEWLFLPAEDEAPSWLVAASESAPSFEAARENLVSASEGPESPSP